MPPSRTRIASGRLPGVDGLRGIAALCVVVTHFNPGLQAPPASLVNSLVQYMQVLSLGPLAVIFFYVLSSFLLTHLAIREEQSTGAFSVRNFYVRRILRIWPLYFTMLGINLIFYSPIVTNAQTDTNTWRWFLDNIWMYVTFTSNWSLSLNYLGGRVDASPPGLAVMWSIAVEEQFYVAFPLLMLVAIRKVRLAHRVFLTLFVLGSAFRFLFVAGISGDDSVVNNQIRLYYATFTYLDVFAAGAASAFLIDAASGRQWLKASRHPVAVVVLSVSFVALAASWTTVGGCSWIPCSVMIYWGAAITMALAISVLVATPRSAITRILSSKPLQLLGSLSFGIYVWHPVVMTGIQRALAGMPPGYAFSEALVTVTFVGYLAVTLLAAAVTNRMVERPAILLKQRIVAHTAASKVRMVSQ